MTDPQRFTDLMTTLMGSRFASEYDLWTFIRDAKTRGHINTEEGKQLDKWAEEFVPNFVERTLGCKGLTKRLFCETIDANHVRYAALDHVGFYVKE